MSSVIISGRLPSSATDEYILGLRRLGVCSRGFSGSMCGALHPPFLLLVGCTTKRFLHLPLIILNLEEPVIADVTFLMERMVIIISHYTFSVHLLTIVQQTRRLHE